tara:strand:+ start:265 stop:453 length:189 start_codon:yes stop_codon:yes gene_type:complete
MTISTQGYNTTPANKEFFWQLVLIPTISVFRNKGDECFKQPRYVTVNFEFLFWAFAITVKGL